MWKVLLLLTVGATAEYRLPKNLKPLEYTLIFEPQLQIKEEATHFNGSTKIDFQVIQTTKIIIIHSSNLTIERENVEVFSDSLNKTVDIEELVFDPGLEICNITLKEDLKENEIYTLNFLKYVGSLAHKNCGFYLAKYRDEFGVDHLLATSDFEPTDARKAFPCFDEPALKAKFNVRLIRSQDYNSVSNEEKIREEILGDNRIMDVYKQSPLMSTYLVAFAVTDYKHTVRKERHSIFANPTAIANGEADFALEYSIEVLTLLENMFKYNFTLNKMDQIAFAREYFAEHMGAMENWGLVTYSEDGLLYDETKKNVRDLQRVAMYISHEFAHQWFGNLVTPSWWNYLWLSEGFATYFQYYATSLMKPSWRFMEQFVIDIVDIGLNNDAVEETYPCNHDARKQILLLIPYYKAASLMRMCEHVITSELFFEGLSTYLHKYQFDVAEPEFLFQIFQEKLEEANMTHLLNGKNVSSFMYPWMNQRGHPILKINRNYENGEIEFSQENVLKLSSKIIDNNVFFIPISLAFSEDPEANFSKTTPDIWLYDKNMVLNKPFTTQGMLLANLQQTGFYRVNYDHENWERIAKFLQKGDFTIIPATARIQLLNDANALIEYGAIQVETFMNLTKFIKREKDNLVVYAFMNNLPLITSWMRNIDRSNIYKYIFTLLDGTFEDLSLFDSGKLGQVDKLLKIVLLDSYSAYHNPKMQAKSLDYLYQWTNGSSPRIHHYYEQSVLCSAISAGGKKEWTLVYEKYMESNDTHNWKVFPHALGCVLDEETAKELIVRIFDGKTFKDDREASSAYWSLYFVHTKMQKLCLEYLLTNQEELNKRAMGVLESISLGEITESRAQMVSTEWPDLVHPFFFNIPKF